MTGSYIPRKNPSSALYLVTDTRPLITRSVRIAVRLMHRICRHCLDAFGGLFLALYDLCWTDTASIFWWATLFFILTGDPDMLVRLLFGILFLVLVHCTFLVSCLCSRAWYRLRILAAAYPADEHHILFWARISFGTPWQGNTREFYQVEFRACKVAYTWEAERRRDWVGNGIEETGRLKRLQ